MKHDRDSHSTGPRADTGGQRTVAVDGATVGEAIAALVGAHPSLDGRVLEGGGVPAFINVFLDGEDIRLLQGLDTPVRPGAKVLLLPAVAGGV